MSGEINQEIKNEYEKIKDKISYEDFLTKMEERKLDYEDVSFMSELDIARTIVGEYINEENKPLSEANQAHKISELETGRDNISVTGRVMHISNVKKFNKIFIFINTEDSECCNFNLKLIKLNLNIHGRDNIGVREHK